MNNEQTFQIIRNVSCLFSVWYYGNLSILVDLYQFFSTFPNYTVIYFRRMGLNLSYATVIKEILSYHPWMQQSSKPFRNS